MFLALSPKGGAEKASSWRNLFFLRFAPAARSGLARGRASGGPEPVSGLGGECRLPPSSESPPRASPQRRPVVSTRRPRRSLQHLPVPLSQTWDVQPATFGNPCGWGTCGWAFQGWGGTALAAPAHHGLPAPRLHPGPGPPPRPARPGHSRPPPFAVTCSLAPGLGRAAAWPAEGPVGPEMWHRQAGRGRPGAEPCRCILFSKKIKYFHGKLSLCVFLSPFLLLFLSPGSSSRVSPVLPPSGDPTSSPLLAPAGAWPCLGPWAQRLAGTPLLTICASLPLALLGIGRVRGWPPGRRSMVSHGGLSASCACLFSMAWGLRTPRWHYSD